MEIKEIIEAFEDYDWDFDCENCGVREKCKKGYYCLMDEAINVSLNRLYDMIKMEDDLK